MACWIAEIYKITSSYLCLASKPVLNFHQPAVRHATGETKMSEATWRHHRCIRRFKLTKESLSCCFHDSGVCEPAGRLSDAQQHQDVLKSAAYLIMNVEPRSFCAHNKILVWGCHCYMKLKWQTEEKSSFDSLLCCWIIVCFDKMIN